MKEYAVYKGQKFTIEWYFAKNGKSQPLDFFNKISAIEQQKFFYLVKRIGDFGFISDKTKFRNENDGIYDKDCALLARADYQKRTKDGTYYENDI